MGMGGGWRGLFLIGMCEGAWNLLNVCCAPSQAASCIFFLGCRLVG